MKKLLSMPEVKHKHIYKYDYDYNKNPIRWLFDKPVAKYRRKLLSTSELGNGVIWSDSKLEIGKKYDLTLDGFKFIGFFAVSECRVDTGYEYGFSVDYIEIKK